MQEQILIENATILSMDSEVGAFECASILIEGDKILEIAPNIQSTSAERIDANGMIAIPGLIDAHRHVWQGVLTYIAADADLNTYFSEVPGTLAPMFTPEGAYTSNLIGCLQALNAGVTTVFDWSHIQHTPAHTDALIEASRKSGQRVVFGYGFPNTEPGWSMDSERPVPEDIRRVREKVLSSDDSLVTMAMAVRGPEQSTLEVTAHDVSVARDLGLRMSIHAGNGAFGVPYRSIERMYDAKLLGPDIQYVHCTTLTDESIERIANSGGSFVATPAIELQMQFGYPATTRFLERGVNPALGVDVVTSTDCGMFSQMSAGFQAARLQALEEGTPNISVYDVTQFATINGAESIGLGARTGSLVPGKKADIVLLQPPPLTPITDPYAFVSLSATVDCVHTVLVGGKLRKRNGQLVDFNISELSELAHSCLAGLIERSQFKTPRSRQL